MRRLSCRDSDALARIFDQYAPAMYGLLLRLTRERDLSDDLLQEAFLKVWTRVAQSDATKGTLRTWLLAIVQNVAFDYFRSSGGRLSRNYSTPTPLEQLPDIDEELKLHRSHWIASGLLTLRPHEKRVLELAYFSGYSQSEIAQLLQAPLGTVKSWTRSALARLREELSAPALTVEAPIPQAP